MSYKELIEQSNKFPSNTVIIDPQTLERLGHNERAKVMTSDFDYSEYLFPSESHWDSGLTTYCVINSVNNGICDIYYGCNSEKMFTFRIFKGVHKYPMIMVFIHKIRFHIDVQIISLQVAYVDDNQDKLLFHPLKRHPPPERAQQLSLHSEGIRLLNGGKVVI